MIGCIFSGSHIDCTYLMCQISIVLKTGRQRSVCEDSNSLPHWNILFPTSIWVCCSTILFPVAFPIFIAQGLLPAFRPFWAVLVLPWEACNFIFLINTGPSQPVTHTEKLIFRGTLGNPRPVKLVANVQTSSDSISSFSKHTPVSQSNFKLQQFIDFILCEFFFFSRLNVLQQRTCSVLGDQ